MALALSHERGRGLSGSSSGFGCYPEDVAWFGSLRDRERDRSGGCLYLEHLPWNSTDRYPHGHLTTAAGSTSLFTPLFATTTAAPAALGLGPSTHAAATTISISTTTSTSSRFAASPSAALGYPWRPRDLFARHRDRLAYIDRGVEVARRYVHKVTWPLNHLGGSRRTSDREVG